MTTRRFEHRTPLFPVAFVAFAAVLALVGSTGSALGQEEGPVPLSAAAMGLTSREAIEIERQYDTRANGTRQRVRCAGTRGNCRSRIESLRVFRTVPTASRLQGTAGVQRFLRDKDWSHIVPRSARRQRQRLERPLGVPSTQPCPRGAQDDTGRGGKRRAHHEIGRFLRRTVTVEASTPPRLSGASVRPSRYPALRQSGKHRRTASRSGRAPSLRRDIDRCWRSTTPASGWPAPMSIPAAPHTRLRVTVR